jgi:branched-chain amino acid transport system substrate-binding protein
VPSTATEFLPYLTNLSTHLASDSAQNSGLYVWVFGAAEISAFKEGVALGLFKKYKVVFSNVNDIQTVANALGASMPTVYATLYYYPTAWSNALNTTFISDFKSAYGKDPDSSNGEAFNAVMAYVAAIKAANTDNYQKVQKALEGLTFQTLQGQMTIDATTHQGDVTLAIVIFSANPPTVATTVDPGQV